MQNQLPSKEEIINFLKKNKDYIHDQFGITKIALFGSYARNEAKEDSDIDLLVDSKQKSFDQRFYLKEYLEKNLKKTVDICYFDSIRPFIMRFVEKELIYA